MSSIGLSWEMNGLLIGKVEGDCIYNKNTLKSLHFSRLYFDNRQ